jgi:hypothetical protein
MNKSGRLTLVIADDGYASVSDEYNFSEIDADESSKVIFSAESAGINNFASINLANLSSSTVILNYTVDLTLNPRQN